MRGVVRGVSVRIVLRPPVFGVLFFAAVTTTFLAFEREAYVVALVGGIVAGLSRPTGVLTTVALAAAWAERARARRASGAGWSSRGVAAAAICGPVLGMGLYSAFVYGLTGHPFMWALVQEGWGRPMQNPALALARPLADFVAHPIAALLDHPQDVLNALAGVLALALVVPIGRRLGLGQAMFVLLGTIVPLAGGGVVSLGRYTAVLFPIDVWLAASLPRTGLWLVAMVFGVLQMVVASLFFTWRPMY